MPRPDVMCLGFVNQDFRKSSQYISRQAVYIKIHWKQLGWDGVSELPVLQGGNSDRLTEAQDMTLACACRWRAQQKNNGFCQYFCLGKSCPSSPRPEARYFSSSLYVSRTFQAAALVLKLRGSETSKSVCRPH